MIRSVFRFAAAVSLLVLLAAIVLGVRGRWTTDQFWLVHGDGGSEMLRSSGGRISFRHTTPNGRSRITFPNHATHWSCPVASQLPPMKTPSHWEWRFLSYEATPAATESEIKAAVTRLQSVAKLREQLGVGEQEWARVSTYPMPVVRIATPDLNLAQAKALAARAKDVLNGTSYWEWTVPAWAVAAAAGILPVLWLSAWDRRRRLRREGRCVQCGYDLRAGHDRCPECGRAVDGAREKALTPALSRSTGRGRRIVTRRGTA